MAEPKRTPLRPPLTSPSASTARMRTLLSSPCARPACQMRSLTWWATCGAPMSVSSPLREPQLRTTFPAP
eukprot:4754293-Alexandrium_andersonii.AAC.1